MITFHTQQMTNPPLGCWNIQALVQAGMVQQLDGGIGTALPPTHPTIAFHNIIKIILFKSQTPLTKQYLRFYNGTLKDTIIIYMNFKPYYMKNPLHSSASKKRICPAPPPPSPLRSTKHIFIILTRSTRPNKALVYWCTNQYHIKYGKSMALFHSHL